MHFVRGVQYLGEHKLAVTFDDGVTKAVDLSLHLDGEIFEPLRDVEYFKTASVNQDLDTVVWDNGADFSPDFLYEIGTGLTASRSAG